jgi:oligopeptide transport system ATP-binding protein
VALLEARNLAKAFRREGWRGRREPPRPAVDDVSFDLESGQTLALVGESGAGKSTTGRLVLRLIEPDAGTVVFDGVDVRALSTEALRKQRREMAMIFQNPHGSLDPRLPIGVSVGEPMEIHFGTNRVDREEQARSMLDRVGIGLHLAERLPHELSGGQLQRVSIARALTVRPKMIVCDEPVAALDVSVRAQVLNLLLDLQDDFGLSYLFISHDLSVVECMAHHVAVMQNGRLVEMGAREQIYNNPASDYVKELLAAVPSPIPPGLRPGTTLSQDAKVP